MPLALPVQQGFTKNQCVTGLRAAVGILEKWAASSEQACHILRISRSTYTRARQRDPDWAVALDADQMQRISFVLNIHATLRLIFDNPQNVYGFPSMANDNEFFNGRTPLEIMAQGDMISLYETFRRIDALRGAQW
ncbi:antitoxin Xre-like helix-turn-helix domain-containing protein [Pseudomonas izuensis]|uniref:antitoxin Xre-like helix-turn-helix domain-containing protein n=1 Tax=Pseudomonas izuensis TaxID=2684212 RepID=UPI00135C05CC|nr:antitoxin Xre-like helix-turn-helix domain-containing protein [Pseudomonas izuensis]